MRPMTKKFIGYYRVSTDRQGRSGLGLEAQREAVKSFLMGCNGQRVAEFTEIESGRKNDRIELQKALAECRRRKATLAIARLARVPQLEQGVKIVSEESDFSSGAADQQRRAGVVMCRNLSTPSYLFRASFLHGHYCHQLPAQHPLPCCADRSALDQKLGAHHRNELHFSQYSPVRHLSPNVSGRKGAMMSARVALRCSAEVRLLFPNG